MTTVQEQLIEAFGQAAPPGMQGGLNPFVEVIRIETVTDFLLSNIYIGVFYYFTFLFVGGIFSLILGLLEATNPIPKTSERKASIKQQIKMGIISLFSLLLYTTIWLWKVDRHLPFYGYWSGR